MVYTIRGSGGVQTFDEKQVESVLLLQETKRGYGLDYIEYAAEMRLKHGGRIYLSQAQLDELSNTPIFQKAIVAMAEFKMTGESGFAVRILASAWEPEFGILVKNTNDKK